MRFQKFKITRIATVLSLASFYQGATAQTLLDLTPPSPKAYDLGKYGQTPVGLFTGTVNPSIPLYTYRTKNLQVPISLSYNSNGIKVDELGSNVGLGWSLNVGGVITRLVRDLPDEKRTDFYPDQKIHQPNGINSLEGIDYLTTAANNANIDSETDQYMFNFNGYSGKFVFDNDRKIVMVPKQDLKIEPIFTTGNGYKITTPDGIVYTFLDKETSRNLAEGAGHSTAGFYTSAWYLTTIQHPNGDLITFVYDTEGYDYVTSQQQTLTITPAQTSCNGQMVPTGFNITPIISYHLTISSPRLKEIRSAIPEEGKVLITSAISHPGASGYSLVTAIQAVDKNNTEIERADFSYLLPANKRVFLQKITMKDPNSNYQLEYNDPTNVPARLSYSQDHWGYYNGASNNDLYPRVLDATTPDAIAAYFLKYTSSGANKEVNTAVTAKGMLTRITYPTKGYSTYAYEPNTYRGMRTVMPPWVTVSVDAVWDHARVGNESQTKTVDGITFDQEAPISFGIGQPNDPLCQEDIIHTKGQFSILDKTDPGNSPSVYQKSDNATMSLGSSFTLSPGADYSRCFVMLKAGHVYEITSSVSYKCVSTGADLSYYKGTKYDVADNLITGGVRLQKTETSDGINPTPEKTFYYYGKKESTNVSTGDPALQPKYATMIYEKVTCTLGDLVDLYRYEVSSNSLNALYNSMGTNTASYSFVTVSVGGDAFQNGGEEHEFILDGDVPANCLIGDCIPSAPYTNIGFSNGKEKTLNVFKKSGTTITLLKKVSNTYVQDPRYKEVVSGYVIQKKYSTMYTVPKSYTCTGIDNVSYYYYTCTTNHEHWIGVTYASNDWKCLAINANNVLVTVYDQCYQKPAGTVLTNPSALDNLNVTEYQTYSYWEYLSSTATTTYDLNGANPMTVTTNFFYDNPVHMQLTRKETNNGGSTLKERTYYPDDVTSVSSLPGGNLSTDEFNNINMLNRTNQYRINTPIQIENYIDVTKRNTVRTIYSPFWGKYQPTIIKALIGEASATNVMKDKAIYYDYDDKGNLMEAFYKNDAHTSYIWGYNGTVPIAVVKNAKPNEILFNSFEENTGWDAALTAYDATRSHTGKYSGRIDKPTAGEQYSLGTNWLYIPMRPVGQTVKYKYSAWVYSTGPSAELFLFMKTGDCMSTPSCYFTYVISVTTTVLNKWVLLEGEYDVPYNITFLNTRIDNNGGGTVWFDDVRIHPSNSQMSTFTYQPMIGLTSETMPNQQIKKYEYDTYNRLKLVRNGDNAIIRRNQYKLK